MFLIQSGKPADAATELKILLKTHKKLKVEKYILPCATVELGNALRIQGEINEENLHGLKKYLRFQRGGRKMLRSGEGQVQRVLSGEQASLPLS